MRSEGYSSCLVCVSVCLSAHAILAVRAIKSVTKDTLCYMFAYAPINVSPHPGQGGEFSLFGMAGLPQGSGY